MKEFLPSCAICDLYPRYFIPRWAFVVLAEVMAPCMSAVTPCKCWVIFIPDPWHKECNLQEAMFQYLQIFFNNANGLFLINWCCHSTTNSTEVSSGANFVTDRDVSNIPSLLGTKAQGAGNHCWFCVPGDLHQPGPALMFISMRGSTWRNPALHCWMS